MGGRSGRNRNPETDPFYNAPQSGPPYDPSGGLDVYDPYEEYGPELLRSSSMGNMYGRSIVTRPTRYGGRYAQGLNQFPGLCPWNYGNYYLGNTTMQMMPFSMNQAIQHGQMQAMAVLNNPWSACCAAQMKPCCMPPANSMPMSAPMMAAATPLPIAFNPLVQGMYPPASMSSVNWMTPSSFMSALTSGPMPYRPPGSDFPSNVGMVMTIPYGTPNPMFSSPYGGYGSGYSCCMPLPANPAPPSVCYYPRAVSVPQPYPVPYSAPVAIPNIQKVVVPRPVSVVAPAIVAGYNPAISGASMPNPLWPSQGVFSNGSMGQQLVLSGNHQSSNQTLINDSSIGSLPVYNPVDQSNALLGQRVSSSFSNSQLNRSEWPGVTPSKAKYGTHPSQSHDNLYDRFRRYMPALPRLSRSNYDLSASRPRIDPVLPPIPCGELISDTGWLLKPSLNQIEAPMKNKKKRKSFFFSSKHDKSHHHSDHGQESLIPRRRRRNSNTSVSEYDCAICKQQRDERRLRKHYDSSTVSSLLSGVKEKRNRFLSSNEPFLSSKRKTRKTPKSPRKHSHKSPRHHRSHRSKYKNKSKSPPASRATPPRILRRSPLPEPRLNATTIVEVDEEKEVEDEPKKKRADDSDSSI